MEIFEFNNFVFGDDIDIDPADIESSGIDIRIGGKVYKLNVTEMEDIDDSFKKEYKDEFDKKVAELNDAYQKKMNTLKSVFDEKVSELNTEIDKYKAMQREISPVPALTSEHMDMGLSVYRSGDSIVWTYKTVYAPTHVNANRIDPAFAHRMITPVLLVMTVTNGNVIDFKVHKIIGGGKFRHYHSLSNSDDCWGSFSYSSVNVETPDDAIRLFNEAANVLKTINKYSLGTSNPKGLPRFSTVEKHLLDPDTEVGDVKYNQRIRNIGIDSVTTDNSDSVWSV